MKLVHLADLGTQLTGGELIRVFGADVLMICAGSCTALPAQYAKRVVDDVMPNVTIPMHYRDGSRGGHRLDTIGEFANYFESAEMFHYYDSDTIEIVPDMEPQVAVLKFKGVYEEEKKTREKKNHSLLERLRKNRG